MPGPKTYAKSISNFNATAIGTTIPQINIAFEVKENFNDTTLAYDSYNSYSYYLPIDKVSMTLLTDMEVGLTRLLEVNCGDLQISFAYGEYYDEANSTTLDIGGVYSLISAIVLA